MEAGSSFPVAELLAMEIGQEFSLHDKLSDREFAVLQLLVDGKTSPNRIRFGP